MKKSHILLLSAIIFAVVITVAAWTIGYSYLSNRLDNSTRQSFIDESERFLTSDNNFKSDYGALISLETGDKMPIKNNSSELTEYYMDFICKTNKGKFKIRVYHIWNDEWLFKYEDLQSD